MTVSASARRFRLRLLLGPAMIGRTLTRHAPTINTLAALGLVFVGLALVSVPAALVVTGFLLSLMSPLGAALRILVRGR
jgi:hypothetical protein